MTEVLQTEPRRASLAEQHVQTIFMAVVLSLMGWAGYTLSELSKSVAAMSVEVSTLKTEVTYLRNRSSNVYTVEAARQDWSRNEREMDTIRTRVMTLEKYHR